MIRFWIALVALLIGLPVSYAAEDLPAPKPRAADVPAPPLPQPVLELPLPDIGEPAQPAETKPTPNVLTPANPNPSGTTPTLPSEGSLAPGAVLNKELPNNNVPEELKWRYKWHNGQWWYWSPDERWMIWDKNSWSIYDPATYKAPAGFAKPGPRVVTQSPGNTVTRQVLSVPLPERYSGAEVSVPESYYIAPTPYAFGIDSYYGPYGPAASYYNRRGGVSISIGTPAYVPVYEGYLVPQYFGPRYTAPAGVYPGYGVPGYYGGRGVTIGFGF